MSALSLPLWRQRLFGTPATAFGTLAIGLCLSWLAVPFIRWALIDASWVGTSRNDCAPGGACWVFIRARFGQFMYGLYPADQRWRVDLTGILFALSVAAIVFAPRRMKLRLGLAALAVLPPLGIWLLAGGFGLRPVETREWGGLMLTLFISVYSSPDRDPARHPVRARPPVGTARHPARQHPVHRVLAACRSSP